MQVFWKNLSGSPKLKIKKISFDNRFSFMWKSKVDFSFIVKIGLRTSSRFENRPTLKITSWTPWEWNWSDLTHDDPYIRLCWEGTSVFRQFVKLFDLGNWLCNNSWRSRFNYWLLHLGTCCFLFLVLFFTTGFRTYINIFRNIFRSYKTYTTFNCQY